MCLLRSEISAVKLINSVVKYVNNRNRHVVKIVSTLISVVRFNYEKQQSKFNS